MYSGPVYNLQVSEDESYVAGGVVVHNCVMLPNPITYRELGLDVDDPPFEAIPTGEAWFEGLSEAEQRAFMPSEAAWGAWQDGKLRVGDFLGSREDDVWGEVIQEISLKGMLGADAKGYYSSGRKGG